MRDWTHYIGIAVVMAIAPFFWTLAISLSLWACKKLGMTEKTGRIVFGQFWK